MPGRFVLLVLSGVLLGGGLLGGCSGEAPGPDRAASAPRPAMHDRALMAELEQHERIAQARPEDHLPELARLQARAAPGSAERLEALSQRAALYAQLRDRPGHEAAIEEMRRWPSPSPVAAQLPLALMLARAQWMKAEGELAAGVRLLGALRDIDPAAADRLLLWRATLLLAYMQSDHGHVDASVESGLRALGQARAMGSAWRSASTGATLAFAYFRSQQVEPAQRAAADALAAAQRDPDPVLLYQMHTMRGIVHSNDADQRISQQSSEQALRDARETQSLGLQALALGNLADFELRRDNFARALALSQQSMALAHEARDISTEILARHNMGIAKIGLRRVDEGRRDVMQSIAMDAQRDASGYTADAWLELGTHLEKVDDAAGAVDAYHRSRQLFDAVLRDETRKAVLEAQAHFEDEQRQREIRLLNQDNSLKSEQIRTRDLQLRLWAEVGACVLVSGALLAALYRRIRRTNAALARSNESLREQSERDPLTGLANRRHFRHAVARLAGEPGGLRGSLFLIDIDHFKRINDQWGHAAGDAVLVDVARRLRGVLREQDLVVRWGGEEFLILVLSEDAEHARQLAQRLLDQIGGEPVSHGGHRIAISASIGFASFPVAPHGLVPEWERAIDLVDTAMYMAKGHGRNKAYGIAAMAAADLAQLQALGQRLEAAWQQGQVEVVHLAGPEPEEPS